MLAQLGIFYFCLWFLCSLIGAVTISIGFYMVMWGNAKEEEQIDQVCKMEAPNQNAPLLQSNSKSDQQV
jgi:hypothetical protein